MSFTIPHLADAAFAAQAAPDSGDFTVLAASAAGFGVISGCAVTAQGSPNMTVAVAAGSVTNGGVNRFAVAAGNVTVGAADGTNPRFDLICIDCTGSITGGAGTGTRAIIAGTAAANPVFPAITANFVVLAAVYVPAADTDIDANQITDKRVTVLFMDRMRAMISSDVSLTATTEKLIDFDAADITDTNAMHDPAGGAGVASKGTVVDAGVYRIVGHIFVNGNAGLRVRVRKNGSTELRFASAGNLDATGTGFAAIVENETLAANDYVEILVTTPNSGITVESDKSFFEMIRTA